MFQRQRKAFEKERQEWTFNGRVYDFSFKIASGTTKNDHCKWLLVDLVDPDDGSLLLHSGIDFFKLSDSSRNTITSGERAKEKKQ
jgi:hypothetical protein